MREDIVMTTFVDTSVLLSGHECDDQAPVVVVVRSAMSMFREAMGEDASAKFEAQFAEHYAKSDFCAIFDLLLGTSEIVFLKLANNTDEVSSSRIAKTAEGFFQVLLSVLSKLDSIEDVEQRVDAFISAMSSDVEHEVKFRLLVTLFNIFAPQTTLRTKVVKALCRTGHPEASELVADCDKWIANYWSDLPQSEKYELFGLVASVAKDKMKYLVLQAKSAPSVCADKLFIEAINSPSVVSFVELESLTTKDPSLTACVKILSTGTFADMEKFVVSEAINKTNLLEKMKAIAISQMSGRVKMTDIASSLKTETPFDLVVRAIQLGVIRGAINEVEGVVDITAVLPRTSEEIRKVQRTLLAM